MQSFSPCFEGLGSSAMLAAAKPDPAAAWNNLLDTYGLATLLFFFFASLITGILSIWVGSLVTAGKNATFGRAFLTWLGWFAASIVLVLCAALGLSLAINSGNQINFVIGLVLLGVLFLLVLFGVPMSVYQFGVFRCLGMILISAATNWVAQIGLELAFFGGDVLSRPDTVRQWVATARRQQTAPSTPLGDLMRRKEVLSRRHEALEIRRKHLPPNDAHALADYQRDVQAYESDLARLKADTAARLSPP